MSMYALCGSPLFSFNGKHCEEMNVAFLPSQYPFIPGQSVPSLTVAGRHGSLRYPGRTFKPSTYSGTLYLLNDDGSDEPITTEEMLRRGCELAAWLCGHDGRGQLILDALCDRYYIAELVEESALSDTDWMSGQAAITFTCQPFARSIHENKATLNAESGSAAGVNLSVSGNYETPLAFSVTNTSSGMMNTLMLCTPKTKFAFSDLGLGGGETLEASYTEDDILLLKIKAANGAERSAMGARTAYSDDDLLMKPGVNTVTIEAERACAISLAARGRWL